MGNKPAGEQRQNTMMERIIDYALEIITDQGPEALTMRKLAARMGTSAPNIYNYYKSKEELFFAIRIRGFERLHAAIKAAYASSPDARMKVKAIMLAYLDFGTRQQIYHDIIFNRPPHQSACHDDVFEDYIAREKLIAHAIPRMVRKALGELMELKKTSCDEDEIRLLVIHMWSLLQGVIQLRNSGSIIYMSPRTRSDYEKVVENFIFSLTGLR